MIDSLLNIFITGLIGIILAYLIPIPKNIMNYIALVVLGFLSLSFIYIFFAMNYSILSNFQSWGKSILTIVLSLFSLAISFYTIHLFKKMWRYIKLSEEN